MPATAIQTRPGQFSVVQAEIPGPGLVNLGVLLRDPQSDALFVRFRRDMDRLAEQEDRELLSALADDVNAKAAEMGAGRLLDYLENTLSASVRLTDRETVMVDDFSRALERLYRQHVQSSVLEFHTHLPRYSLQVAAGEFLENREIGELDWVETPADLRLDPNMFVAQIVGRSMEPLIPDGSLCVFRRGVTGSREGRLVLVEDRQMADANRYTVKRYRSEKTKPAEDSGEVWQHVKIWLEPLNSDYQQIALVFDEEKQRILAEFVRVLD
jgi:phage repressor protein C with HTH and peptisase S24 domain